MIEDGRIGRFVKAARSLLLMQLVAAALATGLAIWAVTAVWELAAERDRLRAQVDATRSANPTAETAAAPAENPILNEVRPPAILPIAIPVPEAPADVNMLLPADGGALPPATNQVTEPVVETPPAREDCTGANADQTRCRPGRWNRPVPQRPIPRPQPEAQQPSTPQTSPGGNQE